MISRISLEIDKEFLEGYRAYKVDEILEENGDSNVSYALLADFISESGYNLNGLFEEMKDDIETIVLKLDDLSIRRIYKPNALDGMDDLFTNHITQYE